MYFASYFSFFKQMTEYDMCIRDWSSDVCSSDLGPREPLIMRGLFFAVVDEADSIFIDEARTPLLLSAELPADEDRNSDVSGQSVSVRVDLGGRRILKQKSHEFFHLFHSLRYCTRIPNLGNTHPLDIILIN